jgi:hypothetical protein
MSDHIGPVIKIHNFNAKYYAVWAIEACKALEEYGWIRQIDPVNLTKKIKERMDLRPTLLKDSTLKRSCLN